MNSVLILTDVDGTLTRKDTMFQFLRFYYGNTGFLIRFVPLIPAMVAYKAGLVRNDTAKRWLLTWYLKGKSRAELESAGESFVATVGQVLFRPKAMDAMEGWKKAGYRVIMVSASLDFWLAPLARLVGFEAICTRAAYDQGRFTGGFDGPNCNGEEKAHRIRNHVDLSLYRNIRVYGDTRGDLQMMDLGTERHWCPFE